MTLLDLVPGAVHEKAPEWWQEHWRGMPEFVQERNKSFAAIDVRFREEKDYRAFRRKIMAYGQFSGKASRRVKPFMLFSDFEVYKRSRRIWKYAEGAPVIPPHYPIYIVSKGRPTRQLTSRALNTMDVDHFVVVEQSDYEDYAKHKLPRATLLVLDPQYQLDYDAFDDLGMTKSKGPGPARNFAWEHSIKNGHAWHWVMDDNIQSFYRLGHNRKFLVHCGAIFRAMESFCERYENVWMGGPHYEMFAPSRQKHPAFIANTRVYSCNLIRNDIPFRWRGRYNEDTDISLRILKAGGCTIQFFAFLQNKLGTQRDKSQKKGMTRGGKFRRERKAGGNTAVFYEPDAKKDEAAGLKEQAGWNQAEVDRLTMGGTAPKSHMLWRMHPDVTQLVIRWGRPHHYVDYSRFNALNGSNPLRLRDDAVIPEGNNEYGMVSTPFIRRRSGNAPISTRSSQRQYVRSDTMPGGPKVIRVHFNTRPDMNKFEELMGVRLDTDMTEVWYPPAIEKGAFGLLAGLTDGS